MSLIWRERFDDGEDRFDVTWVLRKQPEGWRIVGMAMSLPDSDEPDLVNFEAADELLDLQPALTAARRSVNEKPLSYFEKAIVAYRAKRRFRVVNDLLHVKGIGEHDPVPSSANSCPGRAGSRRSPHTPPST
jgi:hypothetical protein